MASAPLAGLTLSLEVARVSGWVQLKQARLQFDDAEDGQAGLRLRAEELGIDSPYGPLRLQGVEARCLAPLAHTTATTLACANGRLTWQASPDNPERLGVNFALRQREDGQGLQLKLAESGLPLASLHRWLSKGPAPALLQTRWPEQLSGTAQIDLDLEWGHAGLRQIQGEVTLNALSFSAKDAAESAGLSLQFSAERAASAWSGNGHLQHHQGALFIVPGLKTASGGEPGWLLEANQGALDLRLTWQWTLARPLLTLPSLSLAGPGLNLSASGLVLDFTQTMPLQTAQVELQAAAADALYQRYLQPALLGGPFADLALSGQAALSIDWRAGSLAQGVATFQAVNLVDARQRFAVDGLNGTLALGTTATARDFTLGFERASIYRLPIGASQFKLATTPSGLQLREPATLPILDGEFRLSSLDVEDRQDGTGHTLALGGVLTPLSLPVLAAQLGWPSAAGKLSGVIPAIRLSAHEIAVDGDLLVKIFDGRVIARDLQVREPLGTLPELNTDLELHDLDLELATQETGFGLIQGSLSGRVDDLRLQAWQPVAMDLSIGSPADDSRPHRISQRAVNSLSALAGGVPNLLSRGLMRLFSTYSYGRMGVGCRLENGICTLHGAVQRQDGALVLVSRGGLIPPYIEVRASGERLAWSRLTDIFNRIRSGELVIE